MNKERMLKLAEVIEGGILRVDFDMTVFDRRRVDKSLANDNTPVLVGDPIPYCGTACCIAGHACLTFGEPSSHIDWPIARALLALSEAQSLLLFFNREGYVSPTISLGSITRKQAVAAIRRMVAEEG